MTRVSICGVVRISNILDFEKDYPDAKVVKLEQNYRSTSVILDAANGVIAHNTGRKEKNLWTDNPGEDKLVLSSYDQGYDEARSVADTISKLRREQHYKFGDFAVLYRTNAQSVFFEEALLPVACPISFMGGRGSIPGWKSRISLPISMCWSSGG